MDDFKVVATKCYYIYFNPYVFICFLVEVLEVLVMRPKVLFSSLLLLSSCIFGVKYLIIVILIKLR